MIVVLGPLSSSSSARFFLRFTFLSMSSSFPSPKSSSNLSRNAIKVTSIFRFSLCSKILCSLLVSRRRLVASSRDRVLFSDLENEKSSLCKRLRSRWDCSIGRNRTSRNRAQWLIRCRCTLLLLRAAVLVVIIFCRGFLLKEVSALPTERVKHFRLCRRS